MVVVVVVVVEEDVDGRRRKAGVGGAVGVRLDVGAVETRAHAQGQQPIIECSVHV